MSLIQLHLSNNILQEVLDEKSAAALWLKLESICMSKDLTSKMHVKMRLFSHKLQEGGSVSNHLSIFREIISDLQSMEFKYEDEDLDAFGAKDEKSWTPEEKRKDRKALSLIQLHLSNNILQEVLDEKSAAALWLKLESICMSKDLTSKMHVKMRLFSHKLQEGGSVSNHLSIFREIVSDLQSMEVKYDDEDLGLLLLVSLPSSFANFCDTILLSRDELTLAKVYDALMQREKLKTMV